MTAKLILIRHGFSTFNELNLFTGWHDAYLSPRGIGEAEEAGKLLLENNIIVDFAFSSLLSRAIQTCNLVLEHSNQLHVPLIKNWRLNEQHFGDWHGNVVFNHEILDFNENPPPLTTESKYQPNDDYRYRFIDSSLLPKSESLKDVTERMLPYYNDYIYPLLKSGKNVMIVGHSNVLRSLIKYIEKLSNEEISKVYLKNATPYIFSFGNDMVLVDKDILEVNKIN